MSISKDHAKFLDDVENIPLNNQSLDIVISKGLHSQYKYNITKDSLENTTSKVSHEYEFLLEEIYKTTEEDEDSSSDLHDFESLEIEPETPEEEIKRNLLEEPSSGEFSETEQGIDMQRECCKYGEPARFQHLVYDFTPINGIDDEEVLFKKCIDFWNFVETRPEFKEMIALPLNHKKLSYDIKPTSNISDVKGQLPTTTEKTAMQWTEELPLNYLGKLSRKYCVEPPPYYKHTSQQNSGPSSGSGSNMTRFWSLGNFKKDEKDEYYNAEMTKKLNSEMDEFDTNHPKTFEPTRRLRPDLIHAEMQRLPTSSYHPPLGPDFKERANFD